MNSIFELIYLEPKMRWNLVEPKKISRCAIKCEMLEQNFQCICIINACVGLNR